MNVSMTVPTTVHIKRGHLIGLIVAGSCLVAVGGLALSSDSFIPGRGGAEPDLEKHAATDEPASARAGTTT